MNLEKLKDTARKFEQKEDWRRAIDVYVKAIQEFESGRESAPDLSLYNRVGDLHLKLNDPASAVRSYERAADLYADQGFLNNAIALCGKILRVNPGRVQTYLKLAQLHARKNVVIEAKRHLIEYIERMNALNQLDDAFRSVKSFADQFSGNQDIRLMLVELLRAASRDDEAREQLEKMAADLEARGDRDGARATRERLNAIDIELPEHSPAPPSKNDLIFLDTGLGAPPRNVPPAPGLELPPSPDDIEVEPADGFIAPEALELEQAVPSLELMADRPDQDVDASGLATLSDLESAIAERTAAQPISPLDGLVLDSAAELDTSEIEGGDFLSPQDDFSLERNVPVDLTFDGNVEALDLDEPAGEALTSADFGDDDDEDDETVSLDYVPDAGPGASRVGDEPMDRAFGDAVTTDAFWHPDADGADVDAELGQEPAAPELPYVEDDRPQHESEPADERHLAARGAAPAASIVDLEEAVLDDPHNPERHRALADALLTNDETERAREEYELALEGYAQQEAWLAGLDAVDALIWLDPDSIRYQQKRVELAFRSGDRARLIDAYLHLGDTLAREGATDKALAVYGRVVEHEPLNTRARQAIATLSALPPDAGTDDRATSANSATASPAPPAMPAGVPPIRPAAPAGGEPAQPRAGGSFVDLGSMILDRERPRDTRMRVEGERPTGDEQRDFQETLDQFKRGIEQNLGSEDYETHYDLGVAFREMGLLDEAIAEFQKALRAPEGRLRTSEALGLTFFDKGQFAIAETILRRAVDGLDGGDDQKIGALYWLGRACEAQDKRPEAITSYERALAVDIRFRDLGERVHRLSAGRAR